MGKTSIEWTRGDDGSAGSVWNPVRGCSRVSPGCGGPNHEGGCYAEKIAARFSGPGQPFEGFAKRTAHGGAWTGKMAVIWDQVDQPIRWRKPRRIFANSMSDLWHPALPRDDVAIIYGTAIAAVHLRGHTIQILTKRADHMRELLNDEAFWEFANAHAESLVLEHVDPLARRKDDARATLRDYGPDKPPPGIWLGVSVEDQPRADERIPDLLATPAAMRFLSCEPLLGPVDLTNLDGPARASGAHGWSAIWKGNAIGRPWIDWVIVGGESGPRARPAHPDWIRSLRDQCAAAEVPFFFKQWGEYLPAGQSLPGYGKVHGATAVRPGRMKLHYGGAPQQAPEHAFAEHGVDFASLTDGRLTFRVGKAAAGAMLDGREHREFPS